MKQDQQRRPPRRLTWLLRLPVYLYRWRLGWLLGKRFLLVTHVGRNSGMRYHTVVEVIGRGGDGAFVVMSGWGRGADWYRNIQRAAVVEITVGRRTQLATHRTLSPSEAADVLAGYERRNRPIGPLVRRTLSKLVGWRYDGSPEARARLLQDLPLVSFAPVNPAPSP